MYNILIVDDEPAERHGLKFLINKANLPLCIFEAGNGVEALSQIQKVPVHILTTDIKMPHMSGLELLREAKKRLPNLKSIIFSAYEKFEYAKEAIDLKANHYVLKPVDPDEFSELLNALISECDSENTDTFYEKALIQNIIPLNNKNDNEHSDPEIEEIVNIVLESIKGVDESEIDDVVDKLFDVLQRKRAVSFLFTKYIVVKIIGDISQTLAAEDMYIIKDAVDSIVDCAFQEELKVVALSAIKSVKRAVVNRKQSPNQKVISIVRKFINNNYMNDISVGDAANLVSMSPNYLSRIFKKEQGQSFVQYLTAYRLERAKDMLLETNMKITDVSRSSGFLNCAYFSHVFKKYCGVTPEEYRKRGTRL